MLDPDVSPRLFVTEYGIVLFIYLGPDQYEGSVCDAWQTAAGLSEGVTIHGTTVRPPGEAPTYECAAILTRHLLDEGEARKLEWS